MNELMTSLVVFFYFTLSVICGSDGWKAIALNSPWQW